MWRTCITPNVHGPKLELADAFEIGMQVKLRASMRRHSPIVLLRRTLTPLCIPSQPPVVMKTRYEEMCGEAHLALPYPVKISLACSLFESLPHRFLLFPALSYPHSISDIPKTKIMAENNPKTNSMY